MIQHKTFPESGEIGSKYEMENILLTAEQIDKGFIQRVAKGILPVDIDVEYNGDYPVSVTLIKNNKTGISIIAAIKKHGFTIWNAMSQKAKFFIIYRNFSLSQQYMSEIIASFAGIGISVPNLQKTFAELPTSEISAAIEKF